MSDNVDRLQALADEVRGLFKEEATEPQRMRAAGALLDLVLTLVLDLQRIADSVQRLADTYNSEELAHLQVSVSKIADAAEVIAELDRRRGTH